jgi:uncharacterized lipoprotein YmbA
MNRRLFTLLSVLVLSGCIGGTSPATRFYSLDPTLVSDEPAVLHVPEGLSIGLGPVQLPDMLDRPHIVARTGEHGIALGEFDQWVGNLNENMSRFMAQQLMAQLNTSRVAIHPWPRHRELDYQVRVDVLRFDGVLGGNAELSGTWSMLDGEGRDELQTVAFAFREPVAGADFEDLVTSLGALTQQLTRQIAEAIARHATSRG